MIPRSTHHKVTDAHDVVIFAGNAKDARRFFKKNGGSKAGLKRWDSPGSKIGDTLSR